MDPSEYCRQIETYLCRKNEGHLIRIVGPVFEQVAGWAAQGVPLAVAFRGIDQYCERYYAKGPRRRPVRVEFCEADVLTLFDDWRRAVGVARLDGTDAAQTSAARDTLPAHLDRIVARLTAMRASVSPAFGAKIASAVRELDGARSASKHARGDARAALIARLQSLDRELLEGARQELDDTRTDQLRAAADDEIAPFASRMSADARRQAADAAFDRLVRDAIGLPIVSPEP